MGHYKKAQLILYNKTQQKVTPMFKQAIMLNIIFASFSLSASSSSIEELQFFNYPNGVYKNSLKRSAYFNPDQPSYPHFHTALNIFSSHAKDSRFSHQQKGNYRRICTLIKSISTYLHLKDTDLLKLLPEFRPTITRYRDETPLQKSRRFAINETWRGLYLTCKQHDINLPKFTENMRNALNILEHDCGGIQLQNSEMIRSKFAKSDPVAHNKLEQNKKGLKRPRDDKQTSIQDYFKRQK